MDRIDARDAHGHMMLHPLGARPSPYSPADGGRWHICSSCLLCSLISHLCDRMIGGGNGRGRSLKPFCRIYEKDACGRCGRQVVRTRMGENARMTFYCPSCQPERPTDSSNSMVCDGNDDARPPYSTPETPDEIQRHSVLVLLLVTRIPPC